MQVPSYTAARRKEVQSISRDTLVFPRKTIMKLNAEELYPQYMILLSRIQSDKLWCIVTYAICLIGHF